MPSIYSGIRTGMAGENHLIYRPSIEDKTKHINYPSLRTIYSDTRWLNGEQSLENILNASRTTIRRCVRCRGTRAVLLSGDRLGDAAGGTSGSQSSSEDMQGART